MRQSGYWLVTLRKGKRKRALLLRRGGGLWRFSARKELARALHRACAKDWDYADMVFYADNGERHLRQCVVDHAPRTEDVARATPCGILASDTTHPTPAACPKGHREAVKHVTSNPTKPE